ncbi:MAG: four helix bundle protein [Cyclobacteriaceae bacterium]|nr:four helix bundle protein [Cyclobacteriaceae bacterium]
METKKFKFENLRVWNESVELSGLVHAISLKFPKDELYILASQIKRAADSVSLNIAEGSTGQTNPEFKRFLGIAIRSGIEIIGCIYLAKRRSIISEEDFNLIYDKTNTLVTQIQSLRKKL